MESYQFSTMKRNRLGLVSEIGELASRAGLSISDLDAGPAGSNGDYQIRLGGVDAVTYPRPFHAARQCCLKFFVTC